MYDFRMLRKRRRACIKMIMTIVLMIGLGIPLFPTDPAAAEEPIRFAYGRKIHYAPQIIAFQEDYFAREGLKVEGLVLMAGIQSAEALISGATDVAVMGDAPAIFAAASGRPLIMVASYGGGERMHRLVVRGGSDIRKPKDLIDRKVAVQRGSSTHAAFILYCRKHGIDPKQIRIMNLSPSHMPEAMLTGQVDAAAGSEPWPTNIEVRVPETRELAVFSGLGNTYPLMMLVSEKMGRERPRQVVSLLRAVARSVDMINSEPDKASEIVAKATGVPVEREGKILRALEWRVRLDEPVIQSLIRTADFLADQKLIPARPPLEEIMDPSFIRELDR